MLSIDLYVARSFSQPHENSGEAKESIDAGTRMTTIWGRPVHPIIPEPAQNIRMMWDPSILKRRQVPNVDGQEFPNSFRSA
ncbi:hypothetical protein FKM82_023357 [Ascaphus truei]